jgi:twitching motility protein PilI
MKVVNTTEKKLGIPYLNLQIDSQTQIALPMKNAQEVISIPKKRITPIPNMPKHIVGLLNQRSRLFGVIDLAQLLDVMYQSQITQQYHIAILKVAKVAVGLMVEKIQGVIRIQEKDIQSPIGVISSSITPFLKGCVMSSQGMLLILDAEAIIKFSVLNN